jgi:hypothetical protein
MKTTSFSTKMSASGASWTLEFQNHFQACSDASTRLSPHSSKL